MYNYYYSAPQFSCFVHLGHGTTVCTESEFSLCQILLWFFMWAKISVRMLFFNPIKNKSKSPRNYLKNYFFLCWKIIFVYGILGIIQYPDWHGLFDINKNTLPDTAIQRRIIIHLSGPYWVVDYAQILKVPLNREMKILILNV